MSPEDDLLLQRAEAVVAEAIQLRDAHRRYVTEVEQQFERMKRISAELDPLLPHPPWELGVVRAILARETEP